MNTNVPNRAALLRKIMEVDFALNETVLYLDTHPDCKRALALYHEYAEKSKELKTCYNENYGPLSPDDNVSKTSWDWICAPWPWEM